MGDSFIHKLKNLIKNCDLFGTFITFRIKDDIEYKSIIGGCSTILFIIFTLLYISYYSINFLGRKNIELIYSYKILEKDPRINLKETKFNLAFGIQRQFDGEDYVYLHENYFNYSMEIIDWIGENDFLYYNLNLKKCTTEDFYDEVNNVFKELGLETLICPEIKNVNYTLEGLYTDNFYRFIRINLSLSDYTMNNLEELKLYLKNTPLDMVIYFKDTSIDYQNKNLYMSSYLNYIYRGIDLNFEKTINVFISPIEFISDESIIFSNPKKEISSIFDYTHDSFKYIDRREYNIDNLIGQILIKASPKITQFNRKYQKLSSFIADLCGILEQILTISIILITTVERKLIDNKLINKILKYKGSKYYNIDHFLTLFNKDRIRNNVTKLIKSPNLNIEKKQNISSLNKSVFFLLNNYTDEKFKSQNDLSKATKKNSNMNLKKGRSESSKFKINLSDYNKSSSYRISPVIKRNSYIPNYGISDKKLQNIEMLNDSHSFSSLNVTFKKKITNLRVFPLTYFENIFSTIFFKCNYLQRERHFAIKNAERKIYFYLNIKNYILKMQEIDLLKYCLFNKDQLILLDFLSRPPMNSGNINDKNNLIYQEFEMKHQNFKKFGDKEMNDIYKSYHQILDKKQICFEDIKLLRLIRAEVDYLKIQ